MNKATEFNGYAKLADGFEGRDLTAARAELVGFLSSEPENWRQAQGALKPEEKRIRLSIAKKFARPEVKAWHDKRGADIEELVLASAADDRLQFCQTLAGDFLKEESR